MDYWLRVGTNTNFIDKLLMKLVYFLWPAQVVIPSVDRIRAEMKKYKGGNNKSLVLIDNAGSHCEPDKCVDPEKRKWAAYTRAVVRRAEIEYHPYPSRC